MNLLLREMQRVEILITSEGLRLGGNSAVNARGLCVKYTTELYSMLHIGYIKYTEEKVNTYLLGLHSDNHPNWKNYALQVIPKCSMLHRQVRQCDSPYT